MTLIHASCVAIDGVGILLRGPSGAGKSDLALRLMDGGAQLVADDQVRVERSDHAAVASPPERLAGLIEVRGLGIVRVAYLPKCALGLVADLVSPTSVERLPEPSYAEIAGWTLPLISVAPFEASAPAKLRQAQATLAGRSNTDIRMVFS